MAKKKKAEPIIGTGTAPETKLTVQKSNPLYGLWRSDLSLSDFKILDTYLSRINSHDPDRRSVRFDKGEVEQLLGVKRIKASDLKERLKHLGTMVQVDDPTTTQAFRLVSLFEEAECIQDEYGVWQVFLTCTASAMKYIFNMENLGYFRYKLRAITSLRSRYSYVLFLYLEKNRHQHLVWEVEVDELRHILKADDEVYEQFKYFNSRLLKRCHKELLEKTDCRFSYEPIKRGRNVVSVKFTLEPLPDQEDTVAISSEQMSLFENADESHLDLLREAVPEFSDTELEQIFQILVTVPEIKLPMPETDCGLEIRRYHYLSQKYAAFKRANERKPIKHRFEYFLKMIQSDL